MAGKTSIEWTEHVWNPIRGCSRISEGCRNCYAERMAARFSANGETDQSGEVVLSAGPFAGFARMTPSGPRWTGRVELVEDALEIPQRRKKPTTYFVNSMSDLFHEALSDEAIDCVFAVMAMAPQHRFIVLTKRAERLRRYLSDEDLVERLEIETHECMEQYEELETYLEPWPLPNVILGVSCEDQAAADERIPYLLETPAACRMVSLEPLIGPIKMDPLWLYGSGFYVGGVWTRNPALDWAIVGGESGPGARPMHPDWARSLRDQCAQAAVPFFFKQWGAWAWDYNPPTDQDPHRVDDSERYSRRLVGKKASGRQLDCRVWDERPEVLR